MFSWLNDLLRSDFMPHGYCFLWQPDLVWTHVISDTVIAVAYFSIPFVLLTILRRRRSLPHKWVLAMFSLFIMLCGLTHVMDVVNIWTPFYNLQGLLKVATACVSHFNGGDALSVRASYPRGDRTHRRSGASADFGKRRGASVIGRRPFSR